MNESLLLLPALNAILNGTTAVLVFFGRRNIKRGNQRTHKRLMISAFITSSLFLVSYLTYHYIRTNLYGMGPTPFQGTGFWRALYFAILLSHTVLAAIIVPLVLTTLILALRSRFIIHRRIARWTYPIWMYVSITGVIIYLMLYQIFR